MTVPATSLALTYRGPAVDDGRMDVAVVAPALLSLTELVTAASLELYPDRPPPRLSVEKSREGSFEVILALDVVGLWDHIKEALGSDDGQALTTLIELIFGGGAITGLVSFLKWKKGRREVKREQLPDGGVTIVVEDGGSLTIDARTVQVIDNARARDGLYGVVEPLQHEGIEEVEVDAGRSHARVSRAELPYFAPPAGEEDLGAYEVDKWVEIEGVNFNDGKLRLREGSEAYSASLEDDAFQRRIDAGEKFAKGDGLRCRMEVTQWRSRRGIESRHVVVEVLEHSQQTRMEGL